MTRRPGPAPSDETLRSFGIDSEERQRNRDEQERQLATLIEASLETRAEEPAASAAAVASQPDELELAERFAQETERRDNEREAHRVFRAAIRKFSPREEPGKA